MSAAVSVTLGVLGVVSVGLVLLATVVIVRMFSSDEDDIKPGLNGEDDGE